MASDEYIGANGGNWFDPGAWSSGAPPAPGQTADLFTPIEVEAPAPQPITGVTIDLSSAAPTPPIIFYPGETIYRYNLAAAFLGTAATPVTLESTADSGQQSSPEVSIGILTGSLLVYPDQSMDLSGGGTIDGVVVVGTGATLSVMPDFALAPVRTPTLTLNGQVLVDGGTLDVSSSNSSGTAAIELRDQGTVTFGISSNPVSVVDQNNVVFDSSGGVLRVLLPPGMGTYTGTLFGFGSNDKIFGYADATGPALQAGYDNGVLTITQGIEIVDRFTFAGSYTLSNFDVAQIASTSGELEITYNPCFATGTMIATPNGPTSVEVLRAGDEVSLAKGGIGRIVWLGHRRQHDGEVIRIKAHALGPQRPIRDLIVSDNHGMFLDGVLVQAGLLVNGETIVREYCSEVVFWHVELDQHGILLAENAPAESYLDTGNRHQFSNCALAYDPINAVDDPCAEMVFTGERLDGIRAGLPLTA